MKQTPNHKLRYPESTDPDTLAAYYKNIADDTERELDAIAVSQLVVPNGAEDAGKILVVQNTGALAYKTMTGDVAIGPSGATQIGNNKIVTAMMQDLSVTTAKIGNSALVEAKYADGSITSRKFKPTIGENSAGEQLVLTTSYQDVSGTVLELTPDVPSIVKITTMFNLLATWPGTGAVMSLSLGISVDGGAEQSFSVQSSNSTNPQRLEGVFGKTYLIPLTAAAHTIKMRAKKSSNEITPANVQKSSTGFIYELFSS